MLAGQITVRQSVAELGFLIAGLALALLLSEYWPALAIVVAAALSTGAMLAVWRESQAAVRLHKQPEADESSDGQSDQVDITRSATA